MAEYVFKIDGEIKACYSDVYSQDGYCPFHYYAFRSGSHCAISKCKCTKTKRPEGCPLVELKPHGRLIDADKLDDKAYFETTRIELDKAPTVVPATRPHCDACHWYRMQSGQFQCVHEHGECHGERFEHAEP